MFKTLELSQEGSSALGALLRQTKWKGHSAMVKHGRLLESMKSISTEREVKDPQTGMPIKLMEWKKGNMGIHSEAVWDYLNEAMEKYLETEHNGGDAYAFSQLSESLGKAKNNGDKPGAD